MKTVTLPAETSKVGSLTKVSCCGFERLEPTAAGARRDVTTAIERQLRNSHTRYYRTARDGTMFVLYYSDGWRYDIVGNEHETRGVCTMTFEQEVTCFHQAREILERHVFTYCSPRGIAARKVGIVLGKVVSA